MSDWIRWCKCQRRILTTEQMEKNLPCEICQKEKHVKKFHEKFNIDKPTERGGTNG
jgi:hypothetical protein